MLNRRCIFYQYLALKSDASRRQRSLRDLPGGGLLKSSIGKITRFQAGVRGSTILTTSITIPERRASYPRHTLTIRFVERSTYPRSRAVKSEATFLQLFRSSNRLSPFVSDSRLRDNSDDGDRAIDELRGRGNCFSRGCARASIAGVSFRGLTRLDLRLFLPLNKPGRDRGRRPIPRDLSNLWR